MTLLSSSIAKRDTATATRCGSGLLRSSAGDRLVVLAIGAALASRSTSSSGRQSGPTHRQSPRRRSRAAINPIAS